MNKYYLTLLIGDIPIKSGWISADNETIASQIIENDYKGKFDNYVIMGNKGR